MQFFLRFGSKALRMFRVLLAEKQVEQKQVKWRDLVLGEVPEI